MTTATAAPAAPTTKPASVQPSRMSLSAVTRGRLLKPRRVLLYGPEGIGKSTFGAGAPDAIFLAPEDGTAQIDVARFPEPATWPDVLAAVSVLANDEHAYRTIVVDTLDWIEPLLHAELCRANNWKDIEAPGYGKGYTAALDGWRVFLARLDDLRARRGMDVVLLAHAQIKSFKNPEGDDFDRYELKLNGKASGLIKEWCDAVLFANHEILTHKAGDKRVRGISTGARFIHTERRAAFDAKNRYSLPEQMPLAWDDFDAAVRAGQVAPAGALIEQVRALLGRVDEPTATATTAWLAKEKNVTDTAALARLADRLRAKASILNPESNGAETAQKE